MNMPSTSNSGQTVSRHDGHAPHAHGLQDHDHAAHDHAPHDHLPDGAEPARPFDRSRVAHIPGWGADLEKSQRPAVPMERRPPRLANAPIPRPARQSDDGDVLHSTERPGLTPVFGTTAPPRGMSGGMRRWAFRYAENDLRHWLMLLAADRVNVVEGLLSDLGRGHVPNLAAEMGWRAEVKHNPVGAARKVAVVAAAAGLLWWWYRRDRR